MKITIYTKDTTFREDDFDVSKFVPNEINITESFFDKGDVYISIGKKDKEIYQASAKELIKALKNFLPDEQISTEF